MPNTQPKEKIAILGGGWGAVSTALFLTDPRNPNRDRYDITFYQQGWRLGGKGASGRGPNGRIEEHGLHIWMGFYNNSFRAIQQVYTEVQPGSYPFMDREYLEIAMTSGGSSPFAAALFVQTSVVSANRESLAIVNAGYKSFATEGGPPVVVSPKLVGASYRLMGDEHGGVGYDPQGPTLKIGDIVEFLTPHCDPTINLYDRYHCVRGDTLVELLRRMERAPRVALLQAPLALHRGLHAADERHRARRVRLPQPRIHAGLTPARAAAPPGVSPSDWAARSCLGRTSAKACDSGVATWAPPRLCLPELR